ncbi:hypothetical protein DCC81_08090 [Chitinophaga parva]|uniref:Uncharacterized protein n=1 Tax=Chitinophaga parva TaxID=2169414 RepID=A0A2T7BP00_9BACT|nr:hypothetical protein [Chitinophaga parva]PUZ29396.1 hypothetical protein DCC81_08090 [Chitinophaga parva]
MKKYIIPVILGGVMILAGCKKYAEGPLVPKAAYIRVFNDMPQGIDPLHTGQPNPFLTFLMDPHTDAQGVADTGAIVGDFMATRELYSLSYPINEANNSIGHTTVDERGQIVQVDLTPVNMEYPGNAHVLTAPAINGFDLSAWAAVPSGKHRILFVSRPKSNLYFSQLSVAIRQRVLIDTVVDLQPGEVYTMEAVSRDLDNGQYGLYIRREAFTHQAFEENKLYVGFVNLSGAEPLTSKYGFTNRFSDRTTIYATYNIYDDIGNMGQAGNVAYIPYPGYNQAYYTTLQTRMDTSIAYLSLPMLPQSSFFLQDSVRSYMNGLTSAGGGSLGYGTLPHVFFNLHDANNVTPDFTLRCSADPRTFNRYDPYVTIAPLYTPNLNLLVNTGSKWQAYSTVNIMEMVYDRVYMMQIQRGFNELPKN